MRPSEKIVELRRLLAERFPGSRFSAEAAGEPDVWPTGIASIDDLQRGGMPKGKICEVVTGTRTSGSALFFSEFLRTAAAQNQIITLIDGMDSFDPSVFKQGTLSRLLWVRCKNAAEAMKATDLILRDRNLPIVVLDLALNPAKQLRRIPSSTWYRLQRIVEATATVFVAITPQPIIGCAQVRLGLNGRFALNDLETDSFRLLEKLKPELLQHRLQVTGKTAEAS